MTAFTQIMRHIRPCAIGAALVLSLLFASANSQASTVTLYVGEISIITGPFPIPFSGLPMTAGHPVASAVVTGSNPAAFTIRAGEFFISTGPNTNPSPPPGFAFSTSDFTASNGAGSFFSGGGPGSFTFCPGGCATPTRPGRMEYNQTGNQFGGIMQILGVFDVRVGLTGVGQGLFVGTIPIGVSALGGPFGGTGTAMATFTHTTLPLSSPVTEIVTGFPWTTGEVRMSMMAGAISTTFTAGGKDTRNLGGSTGGISLIAGMIAHFVGFAPDEEVVQATATIVFLPEPGSTLMLGCGAILLLGLGRMRERC